MKPSAWIERIAYEPIANRRGVLTLHLWSGAALVYGEDGGVPSWLPGLIHAHRSPGRAFNLLVKDQGYSYRRVEAPPPEELDGPALEALLELSLEVLTAGTGSGTPTTTERSAVMSASRPNGPT